MTQYTVLSSKLGNGGKYAKKQHMYCKPKGIYTTP